MNPRGPGRRCARGLLLGDGARSSFPESWCEPTRQLRPGKAGWILGWAVALTTSPPPEWEQRRPGRRDKLVQMSTISKHFGLKYKEESYIFKELEKFRKETKKEFLRFEEKLASKPAVGEVPVFGLRIPGPARHGGKWSVSRARPQKPPGSPRAKGRAPLAAALPQPAPRGAARPPGPSEAAASGKTQPFCPQDFYLRSSAFLRHRPQKKPPVIASRAGTSRPVVLMPPPAPRGKVRAHQGARSPRPAGSKPVLDPAGGRDASQEPARLAEARKARETKGGSLSADEGDSEAAGRRSEVRIHTRFLREGLRGESREAPVSVSKTNRESDPPSDAREAAPPDPQPVRAIPASIEIIAPLQSEAQQASNPSIKELIQSVLGQNYDIKMEDISLMGKVCWPKTPQVQAEQGLQVSIKEPQMNVLEKLPEAVSSTFQIEQEDVSERGVSDAESILFKPQETLEVQSADESSTPLEGEQPTGDSKTTKRLSLKVKSSELLQIKGKEVKRRRKSKLGITQQRQRKVSKPLCDQNLPKKKIPRDYSTRTLHDLCATIPAQELPVDLRLASRVYHTADKKGHNTVLGVCGTSFLDDRYTDEEQRDRILQGIPVMGDNEEYVAVLPTRPGIPPELAPGTGRSAHKPHLQLSGEERVKSAVELKKETITPLEIKDDMQSNMKEVTFQKTKELEHWMAEQNETEEPVPVKDNTDTILDNMQGRYSSRGLSPSLIEASRQAGITNVVYPKKKKMKLKKGLRLSKLTLVYDELSKPPKILKRSESHGILPGQKKFLLKVPLYERLLRCPSVPLCLNFDKFAQSKGRIPENSGPQTWALDMFSKPKQKKTTPREKVVKISVHEDSSERVKKTPEIELSDSLESRLPPAVIRHYESEVEILTEEINSKKKYPAFLYCRRGALYRKLGKLQSAMKDLQEAYISRAEIFRGKKDSTLAIVNYTQAIKCKPMDADIYFRRGEMYEIENKVLAIDDFTKNLMTNGLPKGMVFKCKSESSGILK
ncbi:hypothetical protein DBR06_SOUSAS15310030 [Sousa chinensis]|nr:hypothetical protein DBR06_SOUSAS15310030 [Sousa chinensis]